MVTIQNVLFSFEPLGHDVGFVEKEKPKKLSKTKNLNMFKIQFDTYILLYVLNTYARQGRERKGNDVISTFKDTYIVGHSQTSGFTDE